MPLECVPTLIQNQKEAKAEETEKAPFVPYERTIRFPFSFAHTLHTLIVNFKLSHTPHTFGWRPKETNQDSKKCGINFRLIMISSLCTKYYKKKIPPGEYKV